MQLIFKIVICTLIETIYIRSSSFFQWFWDFLNRILIWSRVKWSSQTRAGAATPRPQ
jgi:hypothetical protein